MATPVIPKLVIQAAGSRFRAQQLWHRPFPALEGCTPAQAWNSVVGSSLMLSARRALVLNVIRELSVSGNGDGELSAEMKLPKAGFVIDLPEVFLLKQPSCRSKLATEILSRRLHQGRRSRTVPAYRL